MAVISNRQLMLPAAEQMIDAALPALKFSVCLQVQPQPDTAQDMRGDTMGDDDRRAGKRGQEILCPRMQVGKPLAGGIVEVPQDVIGAPCMNFRPAGLDFGLKPPFPLPLRQFHQPGVGPVGAAQHIHDDIGRLARPPLRAGKYRQAACRHADIAQDFPLRRSLRAALTGQFGIAAALKPLFKVPNGLTVTQHEYFRVGISHIACQCSRGVVGDERLELPTSSV